MSTFPKNLGGRPARLSRQQIVDVTLKLFETSTISELSMQRIARELSVRPSALYAYFASQNELFGAVSNELLKGIDLSRVHKAKTWQEAFEEWAHSLRNQLQRYPNAFQLMQPNSGSSASHFWLESFALLATILGQAGLSGETLMDTVRSVVRLVLGYIAVERIVEPRGVDQIVDQIEIEIARTNLTKESRDQVLGMMTYFHSQNPDALFVFSIGHIRTLLETVAASSTTAQSSNPRLSATRSAKPKRNAKNTSKST